jgi:hypothetical protein
MMKLLSGCRVMTYAAQHAMDAVGLLGRWMGAC